MTGIKNHLLADLYHGKIGYFWPITVSHKSLLKLFRSLLLDSSVQVFEAFQSLNNFKFDPHFTIWSDGKFLGFIGNEVAIS